METIPAFFEDCCARFPGNIYLREKTGDRYTGMSYLETRERVHRFAAGLIALGVKHGDRIALISEGRNDWVVSELGILFAGAVNVPLSVKLYEPDEIRFRISHSGARMVIASGNQAGKIRLVRDELPGMDLTIVLDEPVAGDREIPVDQVLEAGKLLLEVNPGMVEERWKSLTTDDVANICYTSGTTADPKGIMLTHRNYICNVLQGYSLMDIREDYCTLLILPWDHAFAHTAGIYCFMGKGASIASVKWGKSPMESLRNLPENIREIRPRVLLSVPALAENFKKNIEKGIRARGPLMETLFGFAMKLACRVNREVWNRRSGLAVLARPLMAVFDYFIFKKIREGFGGQLEFFVGGGALLDIEFQRFFYALGIPMFQGYGLTEASPIISSNTPGRLKLGSSGTVASTMEIRICDTEGRDLPPGSQGEIVVKGDNVMPGYWRNPEATAMAIRDGWLYTGDLGYLDQDGFLHVLGRYKSLLIADDGEKYSPEGLEESFCTESEYIDQCLLYNNQNMFTVILLVPAREMLVKFVERHGLTANSAEGVECALGKIDEELKEYRPGGKFAQRFPQRWLPAVAGILPDHFTEENHLLNSTMKIVRGKIVERYRQRIDHLYTPEGRDILNVKNREAMRSLLESV